MYSSSDQSSQLPQQKKRTRPTNYLVDDQLHVLLLSEMPADAAAAFNTAFEPLLYQKIHITRRKLV